MRSDTTDPLGRDPGVEDAHRGERGLDAGEGGCGDTGPRVDEAPEGCAGPIGTRRPAPEGRFGHDRFGRGPQRLDLREEGRALGLQPVAVQLGSLAATGVLVDERP